MCGFFCCNNFDLEPKLIDNALKTLYKRGPNQKNIVKKNNIIFGHTRLSIRDIYSENAKQPFKEKNSDYVLIYNGELWNTNELNKTLQLNSSSPYTEVELIIKLYKKLGTSSFKLLRGMFAFILYDPYNACLHMVRDYFGKKPLYYYINDNHLYAASLTSTLFALKVPKELKDNILFDVAESRHLYDGIYRNIHEVKPGCYGTYSLINNSLTTTKYFSFTELISQNDYQKRSNFSKQDIEDEFSELMKKSISKRRCDEVKSGVILSGGFDSSIISYYASNYKFDNFLHLDSLDNSELEDAKNIAEILNVELQTDFIDKGKFYKNLEETITSWEYPLVHTNGIGIHLLAKLAKRKKIKVLYGGEGADELFGGYYFYKYAFLLSKFPIKGRDFFKSLKGLANFSRFNIASNASAISKNFSYRLKNYSEYLSCYENFLPSGEAQVQSLMISDIYDYLQPLLSRADRLMMSQGVELRMPFLDLDMVSFAINLPLKYKINLMQNKIIIKRKFKNLFPNNPKKNKIGFTVNYYKSWYEQNSHSMISKLNKKFDCEYLVNYYSSQKRYDIILRIASLAYLI